MNNDWEAIHSDLNKRPIEGVSDQSSDQDILNLLRKYGIKHSVLNAQHSTSITLWGTGAPRREFLYSDDLADACLYLMQKLDFKDFKGNSIETRNTHINIGSGVDLEIKELASLVKDVVGFKGTIEWDASKPDGTKQKLLNVDKINSMGWKHITTLENGIKSVYENY